MLEQVAEVDRISLTEQIDALSTRMILDGAPILSASDFERLSSIAAGLGNRSVSVTAARIAKAIATSSTRPESEVTNLVSSGLVELRSLLHERPTTPQPTAVKSSPTTSEMFEEIQPKAPSVAADEELISEFITESHEHLAAIESQLLLLEKDSSATETLNAIFRGFHTIKGLAGFFEFEEIQALAHEVETLLDLARTSKLTITPATADIILESTDILRHELSSIAQRLAGKVSLPTKINEALLERIRSVARGDVLEPASAASPLAAQKEEAPTQQLRQERRASDRSSVRIDTAKLDQLMDMVGEMVIAQTLIGHSPAFQAVKDDRLQRNLTQLARLTADIQRITTAMRMVPIGLQFHKTERLVRDLARRAGKQISFETSGEETELDKTIAEELSDPLLHMVRNSVDHGIELPDERVALGKDPMAHIRLSAQHQAGQVVVAISDDGRGLDREKILAQAYRKGLIQSGAQPTDAEIFQLIFAAGFSTAEKVTEISGRGVGMDVVHRHVQKLRGRIDIQSTPGQGTTFYIKLPLTLAIIEGLVVVVGQRRYIVPIFSVREMFRPTREMLSTVYDTGEMAMVRGGLLPIIRLHRLFGMASGNESLCEGILIVAESEGRRFCLFVDDLIGKQEVVIKSLGQQFKNVAGIAGCTILGDGRVGLILDIDGVFEARK
jgi:two-component system chemotaxis sensor kinase CheA